MKSQEKIDDFFRQFEMKEKGEKYNVNFFIIM